MTIRLKRTATGAGTNRLVPRKASGAAMTAPTEVPTIAMQMVSRRRHPRPSFFVEKKKVQSGCRIPVTMLFRAP